MKSFAGFAKLVGGVIAAVLMSKKPKGVMLNE